MILHDENGPDKQVNNIKNINYIKLTNKDNLFSNKPYIKIYSFIIFFSILFYSFIVCYIVYYITKKNISRNINDMQLYNYSKIDILKLLTNNDKSLYEGAKNCLEKNPAKEFCLYHFFCPKEVKGKKRVLMGYKHDGSYVMLDDFENIKFAYSIGIRDEVQFDKALADKDIDVYLYDHTINKLPYQNEKFHWKKIGLGGKNERSEKLQTLEDMMKENGHLNEKNMILKIDIEGNEWIPLNELSGNVLSQFKYILIEYHFMKIEQKLFYDVLEKIQKTHQVFYVHCCPYIGTITFGNNRFCKAIEVSYIIREGNFFSKDKAIYPIPEFSYKIFKDFNLNILKLFDEY